MITIKYFGAVAEHLEKTEELLAPKEVHLPVFYKNLIAEYGLSEFEIKLVLNEEIISPLSDIYLKDGDRLALLPPFSGG